MSTRTTFLLLLAVVILGAAILGIERYLPSAVERREVKQGPARLERDKVTDIHITDANGTVVTLKRVDGVWQTTQSGTDAADPEKVAALIISLDTVEWIERISRDEFDDKEWAKTGLDSPRHKIRLMNGPQLMQECWLGAPAVIENSVYLGYPPRDGATDASPAWYVARCGAPLVLQAVQNVWRDPKLLRLPAEVITGITLTQASGQLEIMRESEHMPWILMKPLKTRGSKERINELLSILLNIEVLEAKEAGASAAAASSSAAGAVIPPDEIRVRVDSAPRKKSYDLTLKKPADDKQSSTSATAAHRKGVFTVSARNLARLWVEPNALRDHLLAQINAEMLQGIQITSASFPEVKLRNESGSWFLERHGKWDSANGERLTRMLEALNTHEIVEFSADTASDLAPFGLDKPFQSITWTYPQFKPVKLLFGTDTTSSKFYAKYEEEPFVYRINPSLLPSLPPDGIKWKGLGALRFTTFALRRITMSMGAAAPLVLNYDPSSAAWTGSRAGKDITAELDRVKCDRIAASLAKFTVQDWAASRSDAVQALKTPFLRIQIVLGEPGRAEGALRELNLLFANTQPNAETLFLYGQIEGDPDIFYITRKSLLEVVIPPFKDKSGMK